MFDSFGFDTSIPEANGRHSRWRHQMETLFALLALCVGNSPVNGEFPSQRTVTRSFDVFFYLRPNKRLSKQSWSWWFETPSQSLWRHCNVEKIHFEAHFLEKLFRILSQIFQEFVPQDLFHIRHWFRIWYVRNPITFTRQDKTFGMVLVHIYLGYGCNLL